MKNSKFVKILAFIATIVLTVGVTFAFCVSADEVVADADLAVAGKNIVYGDTLTIQYAVSTSKVSSAAKLAVADKNGALGSTSYSEIVTTDKITGTEDSYYVFEVSGIPASDVCEEITVNVVDGEKVGPAMKYSLAEYFFERLYSDGIVNAAEGKALYQKKLYLSYLDYAANAQDLFHNFENQANETLVTDRHYVNIIGGTAGDSASGVYLVGTELKLSATEGNTVAGWNVTTYTLEANGTVSAKTEFKKNGATITLKEGTDATIIEEGAYVGEYFAQYGGLDYNNATKMADVSAIQRDASGYTVFDSINHDAGKANRQWMLISDMSTDAKVNKVLQFSTQSGTGPKLGNKPYATFGVTGKNTSGNCFVFETDIMIPERSAMNGYILLQLLNVTVDGRPTSTSQVETPASYLAYINIKSGSDGTVNAYMGEQGYVGKTPITFNEWNNIRIELGVDGVAKYYVNGEHYYSKTVKSGGFGADDFAGIANRVGMTYSEGSSANTTVYFDNTFVGIVNK